MCRIGGGGGAWGGMPDCGSGEKWREGIEHLADGEARGGGGAGVGASWYCEIGVKIPTRSHRTRLHGAPGKTRPVRSEVWHRWHAENGTPGDKNGSIEKTQVSVQRTDVNLGHRAAHEIYCAATLRRTAEGDCADVVRRGVCVFLWFSVSWAGSRCKLGTNAPTINVFPTEDKDGFKVRQPWLLDSFSLSSRRKTVSI